MIGDPIFSGYGAARFRHHPGRSILVQKGENGAGVDWRGEPAILGHRHLLHHQSGGEDIPVPVCATPAVIGNAGVILAGYDGVVRFLDPTLSREYWSVRLSGGVYAPVVVDAAGPSVLVGCIDGSITRLSLKGETEWSVRPGALPIYSAPLVLTAERLLVVSTFRGRCLGLSLDDGAVRFDLHLPLPWSAAHGGAAAWRDPYASPAAVSDHSFVQCCAEHVLLVDAGGRTMWERPSPAPIRSSPTHIAGTDEVLVVPTNGECSFLSVGSGRRRKGAALGARVVASPALSGRVAAIGTVTGDLCGVDIESGSLLWRRSGFSPRDHSSVAVLPGGDFIQTTERGNAAALRAEDGGFLWETDQRLGLGDQDPRMDITPLYAPGGYLYCASYSGNVYSFIFPSCPDARPFPSEGGGNGHS